MKRIISIFIVTVMVFGLVACGSSKDVESSSNAPNETANTVTQVETKTEKPTETQTEKSTELKYITVKIPFDECYISPENCKRIADMLDGVTIKKGDTIDLDTIPFTEAELEGKYLLKSWLGEIIVSNLETGVFVLKSEARYDRVLKIVYDDKCLKILYAVIE